MNVVFIVGAARSGTTLLYESLCSASDTVYISEQLELYYFDKLNSQFTWKLEIVSASKPNEGNCFWLKYFPYWKRMTAGDVTNDMRQYFTEEINNITNDKQTFINKNPHHSYRIPALVDIFPEAKFIHLIRDGRAVAYSEYLRRRELKEWDNEPVRELLGYKPDRSDLYNIGLEWSSLVTMARNDGRKLGPTKYMEIRYEDLIRYRFLSDRRIVEFCFGPETEIFLGIANMIRLYENEKWKSKLSEQEQVDISKSTYELRRELGYV